MEFKGYSEDSQCLAGDAERLRMIDYQYIVKCESENNFLVGCKEALISDYSRESCGSGWGIRITNYRWCWVLKFIGVLCHSKDPDSKRAGPGCMEGSMWMGTFKNYNFPYFPKPLHFNKFQFFSLVEMMQRPLLYKKTCLFKIFTYSSFWTPNEQLGFSPNLIQERK